MRKRSVLGAAIAFAALSLFGNSTPFAATTSSATSDQTNLINRATTAAQHMKSDPAFSQARGMMANAKGVLIVPSLVKGGFIFGAEGGSGVLLQKTGNMWSQPAFYTLSSGSFGLQAGLEQAELIMILMTDKAIDQVKTGDFKVGAGGGITVATLSSGAAAATGDVVLWKSGTGAYGGLTLNGSVVKPRDEWNTAFYGRPTPVADILANKVNNPQSAQLQQELSSL